MSGILETSSSEILSLRERLETLEKEIHQALDSYRSSVDYNAVDAATKVLGARSIHQNFNFNYLGERFKDYELALMNMKQMGYYLGAQEAARSESVRKTYSRETPPDVTLASKLCTQEDCESDWYSYWLHQMKLGFLYHRKLWECGYIAQSLYAHGRLQPGKRGLGFGCGTEPLPSLFAKFGASIVATDLDLDDSTAQKQGWVESGQHGSSVEMIRQSHICPDPALLANIGHQFVDMNHIPRSLDEQFDFCWSACAFEHLGSIDLGLKFVRNSLRTLKPGGVAVHTTEYNLDDKETIDNWPTVLFQRAHMEQMTAELQAEGFIVVPFDFDSGQKILDGLFDLPPWPWEVAELAWPMQGMVTYLKTALGGFPCTSVGFTVIRPE